MRVPRTLYLYLAREILHYGLLAFVAITVILLSQNLLRRMDDLLGVGLDRSDLSTVLRYLVPMLTAYALPIAFLFGVSLAVSRLASDREVLAMRSSGLGLRTMLVPTLALASLVALLTFHLVASVEPTAQRELRTLFKSVAAQGGMLEPGKFRSLLGRVFFISGRDGDKLEGIMISDRSNPARPFFVFAERGEFSFDEESGTMRLRLLSGDLHIEPESKHPERYQRIGFHAIDYRLDVSSIVSGEATRVRPREMSNSELRLTLAGLRAGEKLPHLRDPSLIFYELQLHRRFALPVSPLLFGLVAVGLSLRRAATTNWWSATLCILVVFIYYALLSFGGYAARVRWLDPGTAIWAPNALLLAASLGLLYRAR
ncbi:MAG: LptF/LptG family permease [Myxococcota bacterium]